ncbi:MAG: hypothetical protein WCI66_10575, partial [Gammaproteobacteria bacterium]
LFTTLQPGLIPSQWVSCKLLPHPANAPTTFRISGSSMYQGPDRQLYWNPQALFSKVSVALFALYLIIIFTNIN